jgi:hypothetical protein
MREQGEKPMPRFDPSKLSSLMTNQNRELLLGQVLHCATSQKVISASQANAKGGELMSIAAGASALKTAVDLARSLRDAAKRGEIKQEEFAGRVGEIYDYIIDSKDALVEAKDEISNLKADLAEARKDRNVFLEGNVYWEKHDDGRTDGSLCPSCWGLKNCRHPME